MHTYTEENYLKSLYLLADAQGMVTVNDLSKQLGTTMPSVNSMVKKLSEKGLAHYESYKPLSLTEKGKKAAALIIRKHRLTEMYLVEKMGFGWEEVHDIAEQIEHIKSPMFFDRIDALLGFPKFDPHGSPIPDKDGKISWLHYHKLSEIQTNQSALLCAVTDSSDDFLRFLNARQISLGTSFQIEHIEDFDGSTTLSYQGRQDVFSKTICEKLLVRLL